MKTTSAEVPKAILGRTNLRISRLALGTVELGLDYGIDAPGHFGRPPEEEAINLVHSAIDEGINLIDTARAYGASETVLGKALQGRRHRVVLATKVVTQVPGTGVPSSRAELRRLMELSLAESLAQLSTDFVDIWQIHNVDRATLAAADTIAEVLEWAKIAGYIRWSGGSFYGPDLPLDALESDLFDVMQVTYSILDQRLADRFFAAAEAQQVGILVRSVLLKGALTERAEHLPPRLEPLRSRSRTYRSALDRSGLTVTPAQAAIAFALAHPLIDSVLVGVRTQQELVENLHALSTELPQDLIQQFRQLRLDEPTMLDPSTWGIP